MFKILQVYSDDGNHCMKALPPGSRYNRETQRIEIVEDEIENDRLVSADLRTADVVRDVANSIFEFLNVKIDCPSLHEDGFMPILAKIESGKIVYIFYKKPLSNDRVILANSAMPHNVKMATMVNEEHLALPPLEDQGRHIDEVRGTPPHGPRSYQREERRN